MLKLLFTENKIEGTVYSMPYPMEICFRILGKIKIDYKIKIDNNSLNIYSPCEKICKRKKDTNVRNRTYTNVRSYMAASTKATQNILLELNACICKQKKHIIFLII
jgi:hypothetical protein